MCSVGEDCCPPTETKLFARSSKRTSRNQEGHGVAAAVAGDETCCEHEGCCPPGYSSHEAFPVDQMEFWGTEVTPGKPQVSEPGDDTYVHVSQAALGPSKDGKSERVVVRVESGGKNVVLGTLSTGKVDQMTLDLIFDREFKLSHTSTSSSVFFCGYRTDKRQEYDDESDEDEDEDEDDDDEPVPLAVPIKENGTISAKGAKAAKKQPKVIEQVVEAKAKKSEKKAELLKASLIDEEAEEGEESDDDEDDEDADKAMTMDFDLDDYDEEDDSEFELDDMSGSEGESDEGDEDDSDDDEDSDEDDEDEDDEDDVAAELGKKRALQGSAKKALGDGKKPRLDTPAKPGSLTAAEYWESLIVAGGKGLITTPGKKGAKGAVEIKATPVSTKKSDSKGSVSKTPLKTPGKEAKLKTPKTDKSSSPGATDSAKKLGAHTCAECSRNFITESAMSQHVIAKHKK